MNVSSYQTFVAMYYALEAANDDLNDEELRTFLTDANPFIWKGESSGDPAVYEEFKEAFMKEFEGTTDEQQSLSFVRKYLKNTGSDILLKAFDSMVTSENWIDGLSA